MTIEERARQTALPAAELLSQYLGPFLPSRVRKWLVPFLVEFLSTTILAHLDNNPPELVPAPSSN